MTQLFSRRIANWHGSMIIFTVRFDRTPERLALAEAAIEAAFACIPRQAKHTLRGRDIFIADTSITTELLSELETRRPDPPK